MSSSSSALVSLLEEKKAKGNELFAKKSFEAAISLYSAAIDEASKEEGEDAALDEAAKAKKKLLILQLHGNRSAARSELKHFEEALADAERAIELDGSWAKGFVRKAAALRGLERYAEAATAVETAMALDKTDKALKRLLEELKAMAVAAEKKAPISSIERLMKLYRQYPQGHPVRLCFLATTWNLLSTDLRWNVFKRFLLIIGGEAAVDESLSRADTIPTPHISRFKPEMLSSLPMDNYEGISLPDNWLAFVQRLAETGDPSIVDLFDQCYNALNGRESGLVLEDVRTFFTPEGRQAAAGGANGPSHPTSATSASAASIHTGRARKRQTGARNLTSTETAAARTVTAGEESPSTDEFGSDNEDGGEEGEEAPNATALVPAGRTTATVTAREVTALLNALGVGVPKPVDPAAAGSVSSGPVPLPADLPLPGSGSKKEAKGEAKK